tara:strand:- start:1034 stop:1495 length:462 start_codon:yes stop_codon:yes gene_type:complete
MNNNTHSHLPYDDIVQEALRAVIGKTLSAVVDNGGNLPGAHHFYISFQTQAKGVDIPDRLRQQFPEEMTIVLQNKFWGLTVDENEFSVGLTFGGVPATIIVPFYAVTGFHDPSVDFSLQFGMLESNTDITPISVEGEGTEDGNVVSVNFGRKP